MIENQSASTSAQYYVPIFRHGPVERNVVDEFGGLGRFEDRARQPLPLVEVVGEDHLDSLHHYREMSGEVLVDIPYYLTRHDNVHKEPVQGLLEGYANVSEFFNDKDGIEVPVLSHLDQQPISYGEYLSLYSQLSDEYDQAGVRLFLSAKSFTEDQQTALENLSSMVSDSTLLLFDIVEVGGFRDGGTLPEKLEYLVELFNDNISFVLNAFSPYEETNLNYGPQAARVAGADGFGDFVINRRLERNIPVGNDVDRHIRHYFPDDTEVNEFTGEDYEVAQDRLLNHPDWDGGHCDFCRRAESDGGHHRFWKRVRMGHYLHSVLAGEDA